MAIFVAFLCSIGGKEASGSTINCRWTKSELFTALMLNMGSGLQPAWQVYQGDLMPSTNQSLSFLRATNMSSNVQ